MMNFLSLFFLIFSFILSENCNSKPENTKSTKITLNNDTKISANFIEINRKIGNIILTGDVVIDDGESSLLSEKMTIIFEKKTAENKNGKIKKIFSIDSSNNYLDNFLSHVVMYSGDDISKVEAVQGLFSPLLLEDESIDIIVISSALHHADNLNLVLK